MEKNDLDQVKAAAVHVFGEVMATELSEDDVEAGDELAKLMQTKALASILAGAAFEKAWRAHAPAVASEQLGMTLPEYEAHLRCKGRIEALKAMRMLVEALVPPPPPAGMPSNDWTVVRAQILGEFGVQLLRAIDAQLNEEAKALGGTKGLLTP